MYTENICRFIPQNSDPGGINIINLVYETQKFAEEYPKRISVYRAALVTSGRGRLFMYSNEYALDKNDVFFNFPSVPFSLETTDDFEFMYISFIGVRANMIADKLKISPSNCVFHGMGEIETLWKKSIGLSDAFSDLRSESVLLYMFSVLGERIAAEDKKNDSNTVLKIKKYIDENYSAPDLSLRKISRGLLYSEKYISGVFRKGFKCGVSEYITTIRLQHACEFMQQGLRSVSDIALMCGYRDPLYFSRVFKKHMGTAPRDFMKQPAPDNH